jgi:hypothetical protein
MPDGIHMLLEKPKRYAAWQTRPSSSAYILSLLCTDGSDERVIQVNKPVTSASRNTSSALGCPFCGVYEHSGRHDESGCLSCRGFLSEGLLQALCRVSRLHEIYPGPAPVVTPPRLATTGRREHARQARALPDDAGGDRLRAAV